MTRVATIPVQRAMSGAIQRTQQKLAASQLQLATQKKAHDYASLGTATVRNMSARSMVERTEAHSSVAKRVATTLSLYDAHMTDISDAVTELRTQILSAVGTGRSAGLQDMIGSAFETLRYSLNAGEGGVPLFAGSRTDTPAFKPVTLADTLNYTTADAFGNDDIQATARISEKLDLEVGVGASDVGGGLFDGLRKLAGAGTIGDSPTAAQITALKEALDLLGNGLADLRGANAGVGRKQVQAETIATRLDDRVIVLKDVIAENEDADMGQVAMDLAQHRATLEASYSVFAQLSKLSLANYLR